MIVKVMPAYFFRFNVSFAQENLETLGCYNLLSIIFFCCCMCFDELSLFFFLICCYSKLSTVKPSGPSQASA